MDQEERVRLSVTIPAVLSQKLEDYRFDQRFHTRSEAVEKVLESGLATLLEERAA